MAPVSNLTVSFGTGPIYLDAANVFAPLRLSAARTNNFSNPYVIWDKSQIAGALGDGGGILNFDKNGNVVTVLSNSGGITLGGKLQIQGQGANQGSTIPAIFSGTTTIVGKFSRTTWWRSWTRSFGGCLCR